MSDVEKINSLIAEGKKGVIVGGGLLGLEAAFSLSQIKHNVPVVHIYNTLMEKQLDEESSSLLKNHLQNQGISFYTPTTIKQVIGSESSNKIKSVELQSGKVIPADYIIMAAGVKPHTELAVASSIDCKRGILVDNYMHTSADNIYAIGECAEHKGKTFGLVAPAYEMAKVCAKEIINKMSEKKSDRPFIFKETGTHLKVSGIKLFSIGDPRPDSQLDELKFCDKNQAIYKNLKLKNNKLESAILFGDTTDTPWYQDMIKNKTNTESIRNSLIFGETICSQLSGNNVESSNSIADMPAEKEICGCNGVCKSQIISAIHQNKLSTLEEVKAHTKASSSCGGCTPLVEKVLSYALGDKKPIKKKVSVCACTELTHMELRNKLKSSVFSSLELETVMQQLNWLTPDGCSRCRPSLNYYLLFQFPDRYKDNLRARTVNERLHANIQKDGTYSVIPRIWGGVTNPHELASIANLAKKYKVPTVKFTGGQRINLLGIEKKDLPSLWKDLNKEGMISGYAYGKSIRTVKTCVGSEWCRFGVQDSTGLGIKLEKAVWGSWTPAKVKFGVSGCPRNCAEATIKDIGLVAVESGWELYVAGNGGTKVRVAEKLVNLKTDQEAMIYSIALLQFYREDAHYLERTAHWRERIGLKTIEEALSNDQKRKKLYERFLFSQSYYQEDPWSKLSSEDNTDHGKMIWEDIAILPNFKHKVLSKNLNSQNLQNVSAKEVL